MKSYNDLNTEAQNSETLDIHKLSTINILKKINDEDNKIATIVRKSINEIKKTTELAINSVKSGVRIFYIGSGTSGRLGVLDASEIPPTYSASKNTFIGIISGGDDALRNSVEGAEDSSENAIKDLSDRVTAFQKVILKNTTNISNNATAIRSTTREIKSAAAAKQAKLDKAAK